MLARLEVAELLDLDNIRKTIVKGLKEYLNIPVIRGNQTGEAPSYPYLSYNITTLLSTKNGSWGKYDDGEDRKPCTQTWSISVQSDNASKAMELVIKAKEWLDHIGTVYLNDNGVIVQSTTNINDRSNLLTIEYEYRYGFDCILWFLSGTNDVTEQTGTIETAEIKHEEIK
jgi:hypothetical protein